ncbi:laccase [Nocardioides sp. YIM 123512]|uniref:Laccase n=1 Tax=Nocardioides flavescens TaxID=2691959 RepID=A0A6L7F2A9_9ACTN|nr:laccase [Nocardioides flavescens]
MGFTDAGLDLQGHRPGFADDLARLEAATGVTFARLSQVHGDRVVVVDRAAPPGPRDDVPEADALVTTLRGVGLMVRAADCVPLVLADAGTGVIGAAHAGRPGMALGVATRTVEAMRDLGATDIAAWIGPRVCGGCYEVPAAMREEVAERVPASRATTTWGTPSLDVGAGVRAQLEELGVAVVDLGGCTREDERYHSFRRDGAAAGRHAGVVWRR